MLQRFPFFGNQNFINVKCQNQSPSVLKYFPKILRYNLCACIFCTKTDFLPFPVIHKTFDYIERGS